MNLENPTLSVITPTYKGKDRLSIVYKSLMEQKFQPLEWIVVLDGGDEETERLLKQFEIHHFNIKIIINAKNHKKSAVNAGIKVARGDFVIIADDDDPFPENSFKEMMDTWKNINNKYEYVGVTGLCDDGKGEIVGDLFPKDIFDSNAIKCSLYYKIKGEKWGMQRRDIMLLYPFFEDAEGYIGESTVWMEIAKKYKTRYFNKVVRNYIVREDSIMTLKYDKVKISSNCQAYTYGYRYTASNFLKYIVNNPKYIFGCCCNYARFFLHSHYLKKNKLWMKKDLKNYELITLIIGFPLGFIMFISDVIKYK